MSSSRVAVKPRAMNSSSAASMMAWRRSAARAARLDGASSVAAFGNVGFAGFAVLAVLADAAFPPRRRLAGLDEVPSLGVVRELGMDQNMTDRSVIVNRIGG